jgi:signal transduction histidine kinase
VGPNFVRRGIGIGALATAYFLVAELGLHLATVTKSVTLVWPATGLALAALHRGGMGLWPGVWLGAFAANALTPGVPVGAALTMATGNTLEAVVGSHLLRRFRFDDRLERIADVVRFTFLACMASTLVSATIGSLALWLGGVAASEHVLRALGVWWMGDFTGDLVFAPILFTCVRREALPRPTMRSIVEAVAVLGCLIGVTWIVFGAAHLDPTASFAQPYMIFPVLIWAAVRFGPPGASVAMASMSTIAVWATAHQHGPFARATMAESLLSLQAFTCLAALTPMFLAAAISERDHAKLAIEDVVAVASHELKTPLTTLLLNLDLIARFVARQGPAPETITSVITSSRQEIVSLTGLLNALLDMTRARIGQLTLERKPLDFSTVVREAVEALRDQLADENCELVIDVEGAVEGSFDAARLRQVVVNLVTNAMKFASGKPVKVSVRRREHGRRRPTAVLEVRDHGMGIAKAERARIFDRFARASSAHRVPGLGLGLFIVREIVEAHGGLVRVESAEGEGSTFVVELPLS